MPDDAPKPAPRRRLITRRRLLVAGGGLVGAAAALVGYQQLLRFGRSGEKVIADHRVQLPSTTPRMVIARGRDPALNVRAALERLGGMQRFVRPEDIVVIKPNIGWERTPAQGANTHPVIVAALVRACRDSGARRVVVTDCPVRKSRAAFERSGILAAAREAGAEVVIPEESRLVKVVISARLGVWDVLEPFALATKIINVPVAKRHPALGYSCGMKNWLGITNMLRLEFHNDLQRSIAELAALMRPTLTVVDASRILLANSPDGGSLDDVKRLHAIAAGTDPVAMDAWGAEQTGVTRDAMPEFLALTERMGLGTRDWRGLQPEQLVSSGDGLPL